MKTRKISAVVVAFALMAVLAKPQITFAQVTPAPIRGSWEGVKAVPPGDKVEVKLRNGQTLKGRMISASDTALTIERRNNTTDLDRGDVLRVYRMVEKSDKKRVLLGLLIGMGVGVLLGTRAERDGTDDPGLATFIGGVLGASIGAGIGALFTGRTQRVLIYETR